MEVDYCDWFGLVAVELATVSPLTTVTPASNCRCPLPWAQADCQPDALLWRRGGGGSSGFELRFT